MTNNGMKFSKGDIVLVEFPFSNLIDAKKRPVLIIGEKEEDIITLAITSNPESEGILLDEFSDGTLPFESKAKHWQIHTLLKSLVSRKIAKISKKKYDEIIEKVYQLVR
ncbi:type II toxin-antitoxin system PemK/MazF family toxin [Candidatus Woesearchaeota archaeon]|nr:type II toxin-antitoxin system PemK/MazF family toxin [Candidatus Woesearchaeota archaeon]